jgi:putative ABC transport system substrate-binding protein
MWYSAVGFLVTLTLSLLAVPLAADAQQARKVYRMGYLSPQPPPPTPGALASLDAFRQGLRALGYVEGEHFVIESRFADANLDRLPELAAELVQLQVDVIVTLGTPTVRAAKNATTTIPIVMAGSGNPVELGLVASLARPGGNITGVTHTPGPEMAGKGLALLKEAAPAVSRVAVFWDAGAIHEEISLKEQQAAAEALGITLLPMEVKTLDDLKAAFAAITLSRAEGLFVFPNFINGKHQNLIVDFAVANQLPTLFQSTGAVRAGGLISYYTNWPDLRRRAATYVDKILKGAKPADLPVEQPTKFELVINLKTAKALGLTMPPSLLLLADEVLH